MSNGSGLSCGDRNRNARLARLRELVPHANAIVGIDLADDKQAAVVTDHDSRVLAPPPGQGPGVRELGGLLDWAADTAARAGFSSVTVACEPTGHRWRVLDQLAAGRGLALVCGQPPLGAGAPPRSGGGEAWAAYIAAKTAAEADLRARDLDWTILRPGGLTDAPATGRVQLAAPPVPAGAVPRADVAAVIAALLDEPDTRHQTLELVGGDSPVATAVQATS